MMEQGGVSWTIEAQGRLRYDWGMHWSKMSVHADRLHTDEEGRMKIPKRQREKRMVDIVHA